MNKTDRILIVDDEETFRLSTADLLHKEGYECDTAPDTKTALDLLQASKFDLLISDIKMPGNAELQFIEQVQRITDEGIPVILVTGYPTVKTAVQSIQLPVTAYLVKPFDFEELLNHVRSALKRHELYKAANSTRERLQSWQKELSNAEASFKSASQLNSPASVETFLMFSFSNLLGILTDLNRLMEAVISGKKEEVTCHLFNCPRYLELKNVLSETVEVLKRTKSSFKSKELGILRKKLEELVNEKNYDNILYIIGVLLNTIPVLV